MNTWYALAVTALGGALGSMTRFLVATAFAARASTAFPWGTFAINVTGSFVIGIVLELATTRAGFSPYLRLFLATGFLGGYTTFSAFSYELVSLGATGAWTLSAAYALGSVILGVAAASAGIAVARLLA